jgi:hypothetical protein
VFTSAVTIGSGITTLYIGVTPGATGSTLTATLNLPYTTQYSIGWTEEPVEVLVDVAGAVSTPADIVVDVAGSVANPSDITVDIAGAVSALTEIFVDIAGAVVSDNFYADIEGSVDTSYKASKIVYLRGDDTLALSQSGDSASSIMAEYLSTSPTFLLRNSILTSAGVVLNTRTSSAINPVLNTVQYYNVSLSGTSFSGVSSNSMRTELVDSLGVVLNTWVSPLASLGFYALTSDSYSASIRVDYTIVSSYSTYSFSYGSPYTSRLFGVYADTSPQEHTLVEIRGESVLSVNGATEVLGDTVFSIEGLTKLYTLPIGGTIAEVINYTKTTPILGDIIPLITSCSTQYTSYPSEISVFWSPADPEANYVVQRSFNSGAWAYYTAVSGINMVQEDEPVNGSYSYRVAYFTGADPNNPDYLGEWHQSQTVNVFNVSVDIQGEVAYGGTRGKYTSLLAGNINCGVNGGVN